MSGLTLESEHAGSPTNRDTSLAGVAAWAIVATVVGAFLGVLTVGFIYILVFGYFVFTPEDAERSGAARELATGWAPALFFVLSVWVAAFLVGARAREWGIRLGLLLGVSAAATEQAMILFKYPPILINELALFAGLGILAGLIGGWFSMLERAKADASEKVLFDETVNIARAKDPDEVAQAIANLLGPERVVSVGVWRDTPWDEGAFAEPAGVWQADGPGSPSVAALLREAGRRALHSDRSVNPMSNTLSSRTRKTWADAGVRSAFIGPLICMGGERLGFLFVGFRRTTLFSGSGRRRLLSAAAAAGLALEKLAGLEKQREQDRKLGIMEERERVSREIHDSLIQYLGSIAGELDAAEMATEVGAEEMAPHHISRAREATRRATGETRRVMRALRPEILERSSLTEALEALTRHGFEEHGIETTLEVIGDVRPLAPETEHDLIRIAQEALSNTCKHSQASRVSVLLTFESEHVTLEVTDDGIGFHAIIPGDVAFVDGGNGGFGLHSMRERTERIAGRMRVESSAGTGTKVIVKAPVRNGRG
ncbi:MAG TPA: sensor histidine kinase [Rubrobacteraceae bacterium]|nr:sensor histidine kinase [Rubrobacteraceae bacterium]